MPLVKVPIEDRASLSLDPEAMEKAKREAARGAAAFATDDEIRGLERECEELQARGAAGQPTTGEARTAAFGKVYQGEREPPDLGPPPADGTFVWAEGDPEFLDPNQIAETAGTNIAGQMFEGLLSWAAGNRPPLPGMAERYDVSEDGLAYTFHLREGAVWSDGTPLGAEDFRWSWLRGLDPATGSRNAQQLWAIRGAKAYQTGQTKDPAGVGIEVVDPKTLRVVLEQPTPYFPDMVAYIAYAPVPRHAVERHDKQWVRPENLVVNGPYRLTEWKPRDRMVLEKNPRYWDAANVAIPRTVVLMSDDERKNLRYYESGQAHYVQPIPEDKVRDYIRSGRSDLHIDHILCTYYYHFRTDRPPFDDLRLRRAFNQAIDKERLVRHVLGSKQVPATHLLSDVFTAILGYVPAEGDPFDPQSARELLQAAGHPEGVGLAPIELLYNTYESHKLVAEFAQRSWKDALGLEVAANNMEWRSLLKRAQAGDFQVLRTSWCADYPDPMSFLAVFHSQGESNYAAYRNPAYDRLLDRILRETDRRRRNVLLCAAEKTLNRDVPFLPFYFYTRAYLLRPFVKGLEPQYQDHHLVKYMRIEAAPGGGGD